MLAQDGAHGRASKRLNDGVEECNSKQVIHFMSVDTEGSLGPCLPDRWFPVVVGGGVLGFPA